MKSVAWVVNISVSKASLKSSLKSCSINLDTFEHSATYRANGVNSVTSLWINQLDPNLSQCGKVWSRAGLVWYPINVAKDTGGSSLITVDILSYILRHIMLNWFYNV